MGFLGIFGKKKEEPVKPEMPAEKVSLEVPAVAGWIDSRFEGEIESERMMFCDLSRQLMSMTADLQNIINSMRGKEFEKGDRMYAAVNMIKDTWAKKALNSITVYRRDVNEEAVSLGTMNFSDFRSVYHGATKLMNDINMIPKQKIVLRRYFEKESNKMGEILKTMGEKMEEMRTIMGQNTKLKILSNVEKMIDESNKLADEVPVLVKDIEELEDKLKWKKKELSEARNTVSEVDKSPEWGELDELKKELDACSRKKDELENRVTGKLGDLKRTMKLFAHDCKDLDKLEKKLAGNLSHSPLKTYLSTDPSQIQELFKKFILSTKTGGFTLSKKDGDKVRIIDEIVKSGWLAIDKSKYDDLNDKCDSFSKKMAKIEVNVQKKDALRTAEKAGSELERVEREREETERKMSAKKAEIEKKKNEISEYIMNELGAEVEVL